MNQTLSSKIEDLQRELRQRPWNSEGERHAELKIADELTPLLELAKDMERVLLYLANEASGFLSMADQRAHGITNMRVLKLRIDEARELLSSKNHSKENQKMIDPAFEVHMLNEDGKGKATVIACKFHELICGLEGLGLKPGREMSIVRTKLEEACFFAKKAMANQKENQA